MKSVKVMHLVVRVSSVEYFLFRTGSNSKGTCNIHSGFMLIVKRFLSLSFRPSSDLLELRVCAFEKVLRCICIITW